MKPPMGGEMFCRIKSAEETVPRRVSPPGMVPTKFVAIPRLYSCKQAHAYFEGDLGFVNP